MKSGILLKDKILTNIRLAAKYIVAFLKWIVIATIIGIIGGIIGSLFHISVDYATELRIHNSWIILLLPVGGLAIAGMYSLFAKNRKIDTNRVILSVRKNKELPIVMIPLIFVSTVITHLLGGSSGREGAALQLGGSMGYNLGKVFRLNEKDRHIIIMAGMSSVFAAVFGTPVTAAVFSLEVISVGVLNYAGMLPCIFAATVASRVSTLFGLTGVKYDIVRFEPFAADVLIRVVVLAFLCAIICIVFCAAIRRCEHLMDRLIHNKYIRSVVGGVVVVAITFAMGSFDYNGAGMDVIADALSGNARPEAFIIKIILTAITISAGFKGGEIVPAFFIGSTFGCVVGSLVGLDAGFAAAIGFIALFCGVVNCPIASVILSIEVFGTGGLIYFAVACAVSYMMSGYFGLYESQKIVYSKIDAEYVDMSVK